MEFSQLAALLWKGSLETLYMVLVSMIVSYIVGIPLGVLLFVTDKNGICRCKPVNVILGVLVNLTAYAFAALAGGEGFMRLNLAAPRSIIKQALQQLEEAVSQL